jgi:hypothetical protein
MGKKKTVSADELQKMIEVRAYELFLARKGGATNDEEDWLQAEAEVKKKYGVDNAE